MASRTSLLSLAEFHRLYDDAKPAYEYREGVPTQKSMPTILHSFVQFVIMMLLDKAGWNTGSEVRLKIMSGIELVPDVIAMRETLAVKSGYPASAPELCIEILSPNDRFEKTQAKAGSYLSWGTEVVWIIDPEKPIGWIMTSEGTSWIESNGALQIGDTKIPLPMVFAEVDKKMALTESVD